MICFERLLLLTREPPRQSSTSRVVLYVRNLDSARRVNLVRFSSSPLTATPYSRAPLGSTDIVTHLGICSSTDPGSANRFLVSDFVTASQDQRKFFSKVVSKITKGSYRLGAVRLISRTLFMNPKLMNFSFLDFSGFCQHCKDLVSRSSRHHADTLY